MRLGILTGGGDCPGLNAAIRSAVRFGDLEQGHTFVGFRDGWKGVLEDDADELTFDDVRGILPRGGTILGTSGVQPQRVENGAAKVREAMDVHRLDGFIVIGGEGTIGASVEVGVPVVGVPKTIDNDVRGTDASIGFQTAAQIATDLIDRLYSTAESHSRVMVCEVMGRHAGWIGYTAGVATGADVICLPEHPFDPELVCRRIREVIAVRRTFAIVVVSEGSAPAPGTMPAPHYPLDENGFPKMGGIGALLAAQIGERTGFETRVTVLGHVQRGGSPVAADRVLATRLAKAAVIEAAGGRWGVVVGEQGAKIGTTTIEEVAAGSHVVPPDLWQIPEVLCS